MTLTGKPDSGRRITFEPREDHWCGQFQAMAGPCEVLIQGGPEQQARSIVGHAAHEAWRIERKFSRYRNDNILHKINHAHGRAIKVDGETARLLNYAEHCYQLSDGQFDITSGILRRAWHFDGSDRLPTSQQICDLLPLIGWSQARWNGQRLSLQAGMEIDFGGFGKEYAVDRVLDLVEADTEHPCLVNFGGDLRCTGPRKQGQPWRVGVENIDDPDHPLNIELYEGALATSGDARRYLLKDGQRYSHILNPQTGWPIEDAPRSVTVAATNCSEAGLLATLASLQGGNAQSFLQDSGFQYWCQS